RADDHVLGDRRVEDPLAELFAEPREHAEYAAEYGDVLAVEDHGGIAPHLLGERLADRLPVADAVAHVAKTLSNAVGGATSGWCLVSSRAGSITGPTSLWIAGRGGSSSKPRRRRSCWKRGSGSFSRSFATSSFVR